MFVNLGNDLAFDVRVVPVVKTIELAEDATHEDMVGQLDSVGCDNCDSETE